MLKTKYTSDSASYSKSKNSDNIIDISLAPGPVSDTCNIRWKERSLTIKLKKFFYGEVSSIFSKIHNFVWSQRELRHGIIHYPCYTLQWNRGYW